MMEKRKARLAILLVLWLTALFAPASPAEAYRVAKGNERPMRQLLDHLLSAYEKPSGGDAERLNADLAALRRVSEGDYRVGQAIRQHWQRVYLDPDYQLILHPKGETLAKGLADAGIPDSEHHAFVVLGYELKNGDMTEELKARCDAAAAAARAFPKAVLVCSGGATGSNNPQMHTEAGLMRAYLSEICGIEAGRILVDERAMTTLENAINTFAILREAGVTTFTVVTSSYHQRWGQVLYNAMAALVYERYGAEIRLIGNYSCPLEPSNERYRQDARIAIRQLKSMLGISE